MIATGSLAERSSLGEIRADHRVYGFHVGLNVQGIHKRGAVYRTKRRENYQILTRASGSSQSASPCLTSNAA